VRPGGKGAGRKGIFYDPAMDLVNADSVIIGSAIPIPIPVNGLLISN
jgi:hypothetical protein